MIQFLTMYDPYVGNLIGIILILTIYSNFRNKIQSERKEYRILFRMVGIIFVYCLAEIVANMVAGRSGFLYTEILYLSYSLLFIGNMLLEYQWIGFVCEHIGFFLSKSHKLILKVIIAIGTIGLLVNIRYPFVFSIEEQEYINEPGYFIYFLIGALFIIDSIVIYYITLKKGGVLKFFPINTFIVPAVLGLILESFTDFSIIGACNAIACAAVVNSLQNEVIYRDTLTGLYNRFYLEELKNRIGKDESVCVSGIMLDLNGFKEVNDRFGHAEGDTALIMAAEIIRKSVGSIGDTIRYAGDEFIIILNTWEEEEIRDCMNKIRKNMEEYNKTSNKPYQLSASMGSAAFNMQNQSANEFLNTIDKNMYQEKEEYYKKMEKICTQSDK